MSHGPFQILIIESELTSAWLVSDRLSEVDALPFVVRIARSMDAAVHALAEVPCDAVILDVERPGPRSLESLERIKAVSPLAPVIVVALSVDDQFILDAMAAGAIEVFGKDESSTRLFSRVILHVIERVQALEETKSLEGVLAATPDAILVLSALGEVLYVNDAALLLFERSKEEFIGELLSFSVASESSSEVTILQSRGTQRLCELRVSSIQWDLDTAVLATMRDITDQREMETKLAFSDRMVSIGTLAAGMAHEINNPLASVIANLDYVLAEHGVLDGFTPLSEEARLGLSDAREGAERVRVIVRDLKDSSRSEADQRGPVDVHKVLESTIRMARSEIRMRARVVQDLGAPPMIEGNEAQLGQVILNLLVNAAQAIAPGRVDLNEIRITTRRDEHGNAVISVADTGEGIPEKIQSRIFLAFFTTKPPGVGTGLGLAISQQIITSLGGSLTFTSEVGVGTCFTIVLPPSRPASVPPALSTVPPPPSKVHVLVVDDEPMVAGAIARVLGIEQDVTVAADGERALGLIEAGNRFDVVFCDLNMPTVSGMEFFNRTRTLDPRLCERIVFVTGGALSLELQNFLDSVPNMVLDKPFDIRELRRVMLRVLKRQPDAL